MSIQYPELFDRYQIVLQSKEDELRFIQYGTINKESIWKYCIGKKWKKIDIYQLSAHKIVSTILKVSASDILQYEQMKLYQESPLSLELELEEIQALLTPTINSKRDD